MLVKSSPWRVFLLTQIIKPAPRTVRRATKMPTVRFLLSAHEHTWEQRQRSQLMSFSVEDESAGKVHWKPQKSLELLK